MIRGSRAALPSPRKAGLRQHRMPALRAIGHRASEGGQCCRRRSQGGSGGVHPVRQVVLSRIRASVDACIFRRISEAGARRPDPPIRDHPGERRRSTRVTSSGGASAYGARGCRRDMDRTRRAGEAHALAAPTGVAADLPGLKDVASAQRGANTRLPSSQHPHHPRCITLSQAGAGAAISAPLRRASAANRRRCSPPSRYVRQRIASRHRLAVGASDSVWQAAEPGDLGGKVPFTGPQRARCAEARRRVGGIGGSSPTAAGSAGN
jgi:hypothetical protein